MIRKSIFFFFLLTVLVAPLPFASNRPWSWSLLSALIGILLVVEALTGLNKTVPARSYLKRVWPGLVIWLSVAVWMWVQSLPGVPGELAHPLFAEASAIIGTPSLSTISIDPHATRTALMRFLAYGGVFWIAARFCLDKNVAATALRWFVIGSGVYALYGLVIFFLDLKMILWFEKWAYVNDLTSTFVNRNSYATFAGLGVLASAALTFELIGERLRGNLTFKEILREFFDVVFSKAWLSFLCFLLTATALFLTHSRGGFLSTSLALIVLLLALSYARLLPGKFGGLILSVVVVGSLFAFSMSGDIVIKRLENTSVEFENRDEMYARVIDAIASNPTLGTGYGTFEEAFRAFKTEDLALANWDKAHNSYLELAMELGVPASLVLGAGFLWLGGVFIYGLVHRRRRKVYSALGLAALILVAAHATVDFSLQIPGFTVCFAMLMGMAWTQSWPTRYRADDKAIGQSDGGVSTD